MAENEVMNPTNDYIFKRIFGREENKEITKGLISAIIGKEIKKVELNESRIPEKDIDKRIRDTYNKLRKVNETVKKKRYR